MTMQTHVTSQLTDTPGSSPHLVFGSDVALRTRWFVPASFQHPAKLHLGLLHWLIERYTLPGETIADPMAGSGGILYAASLQRHVIAREIEPHWIELMQENAAHITAQAGLFAGHIDIDQADARQPWEYTADHILFSPPYGCEVSTTPNSNRGLRYRLHAAQVSYGTRWSRFLDQPNQGSLGMLTFHYGTHPAQIGHLRGKCYWQAMRLIYTQAYAALRPHGHLILVVKDHIRDGKRVTTAATAKAVCEELGFALHDHYQRHLQNLSLWQRRRKERGEPVVEEEDVLVFKRCSISQTW